MHSEMMAIHSALSLSSGTLSGQTSARAATWLQKPCFKAPGGPKRKQARLRGLKAYIETVCTEAAAAQSGGAKGCIAGFSLQESRFEARTSQPDQQRCQRQRQQQRGGAGWQGCGGTPMEKCGETSSNEEGQVVSRCDSVREGGLWVPTATCST